MGGTPSAVGRCSEIDEIVSLLGIVSFQGLAALVVHEDLERILTNPFVIRVFLHVCLLMSIDCLIEKGRRLMSPISYWHRYWNHGDCLDISSTNKIMQI